MISKAKIRYIRSLELKKNRMAERLFVAEGPKVVEELLRVLSPKILLATDSWAPVNTAFNASELISITDDELCKVSFLRTPQQFFRCSASTKRLWLKILLPNFR